MLTFRPAPTLRVDTPEFQPRSQSPTKNLAQLANAAVFVPRSTQALSSPPLSNTSLPTPELTAATPTLTPHASSFTPMSQPSLSQTSSEHNPYADMDMYSNSTNYMDQVTNGYNQMNLGQSSDYSSYLGVNTQQGQQYDPLNDMYFQASTNYQPVLSCL